MIDFSLIEKYLIPIEPFYVDFIKLEIEKNGKDKTFENHLKLLDCTRMVDGMRMQQTIGYVYMSDMTHIMHIIQEYFKGEEDAKIQEVLDMHKRNLEYEQENPPIVYGGEKEKRKLEKLIKSKTPRKGNGTKRIRYDENGEPIKSAAERKLAARVGKINALSFKLIK